MFGVSSNPKCLNVKSGNPCEPVRFADSPQPAPQSPHKNRGSYMPAGGGGGDRLAGDMSHSWSSGFGWGRSQGLVSCCADIEAPFPVHEGRH